MLDSFPSFTQALFLLLVRNDPPTLDLRDFCHFESASGSSYGVVGANIVFSEGEQNVLHFTILTINTLYTVFIGHTLPDLYSGLLRNRALPKPSGVFFKILFLSPPVFAQEQIGWQKSTGVREFRNCSWH